MVDRQEPEGIHLDYKETIDVNSKKHRLEAAKDISSFANELGGTLLYGIPQRRDKPDGAPIPTKPYGMESIPGLQEALENVFVDVISPMLPDVRIRMVNLPAYPGKVAYVVWTPETWMGPHMVQGYESGRFYRRGQFRNALMLERDVEERYRRRLIFRSAATDFVDSREAQYRGNEFSLSDVTGKWRHAVSFLSLVPILFNPARVNFDQGRVREWLLHNTLWQQWAPSMHGVRTWMAHGEHEKADVEIHRSAAIVCWRYTLLDSCDPPVIAYVHELREIGDILNSATKFYELIGYTGPLIISLVINCPEGYALFLPRPRPGRRVGAVAVEPSGTDIVVRLEPGVQELTSKRNKVLKDLADGIFRAFGIWKSNCFDDDYNLINPP